MSKKPSLHDATSSKLLDIKAELDEDGPREKMFRMSVILREAQKLALEEERLRLRRDKGKSVAIAEMIRWLQQTAGLRRGRRCFRRRHEAR